MCKKLMKNESFNNQIENTTSLQRRKSSDLDDGLISSIEKLDKNGPLIAYISKMVCIRYGNITELNLKHDHKNCDKDDLLLFGFARIFSGTLKRGDKIYVITPKKRTKKVTEENTAEQKYECVEVQVNH